MWKEEKEKERKGREREREREREQWERTTGRPDPRAGADGETRRNERARRLSGTRARASRNDLAGTRLETANHHGVSWKLASAQAAQLGVVRETEQGLAR